MKTFDQAIREAAVELEKSIIAPGYINLHDKFGQIITKHLAPFAPSEDWMGTPEMKMAAEENRKEESRCGGSPGRPNWRETDANTYKGKWHAHNDGCRIAFDCHPCPGCENCAPAGPATHAEDTSPGARNEPEALSHEAVACAEEIAQEIYLNGLAYSVNDEHFQRAKVVTIVARALDAKDVRIKVLEEALRKLLTGSLNSMFASNLPHEWSPDSAMGKAFQALGCDSIRLDNKARTALGGQDD